MGDFSEWMNSRFNENLGQIGVDPNRSGMEKLQRGLSTGQLPDGYMDYSVLSSKFGLNPQETLKLIQNRLILKRDGTWKVNSELLQNAMRSAQGRQVQQPPQAKAMPKAVTGKFTIPPPPKPMVRPQADSTFQNNPFG